MITVQTIVNVPIEKAWEYWTEPKHITKWNFASEDWASPSAENDLKPGGRFKIRMEAKDKCAGFDFGGTYNEVEHHSSISYSMDDGRKVSVTFESEDGKTKMTERFDPETENTEEIQRAGWQAILDNFKKYAESIA